MKIPKFVVVPMIPRKVIRRIIVVLSLVVAAVAALSAAAYFAVQSPRIQLLLINSVVQVLSVRLNAHVSIGSVEFRPFTRLAARSVLVAAPSGDTILYAREVAAAMNYFSWRKRRIGVRTLNIVDASIRIAADSAGSSAVSQLFRNDSTRYEKNSYAISINRIRVENADFQYVRPDTTTTKNGIVNFSNIQVRKFNGEADNLHWAGDTLHFAVSGVSGEERSGFSITDAGGEFRIAPHFAAAENLRIADGTTTAEIPTLTLTRGERISAIVRTTTTNLRTISYFIPTIKKNKLTINTTMSVNGTTKLLNINNLQLKIGQQTKIVAQLQLRNLTTINNTDIDLKIKELRTTAAELLVLDTALGVHKIWAFRNYISAADSIAGAGNFVGTAKNFTATAQIATNVGKIGVAATMESGAALKTTITANSIRADRLLRSTDAGLLTISGSIDATLSAQKTWQTMIAANIARFDYKNYTYQTIAARGALTPSGIRWNAVSSDPNCNFEARGNFTFGSQAQYRFRMDMKNMNLVRMGLNHRDSAAALSFKAIGLFNSTTANHVVGNTEITGIQYNTDKLNSRSPSVLMSVEELPESRRFTMKSDVVDAVLTTNANWSALPQIAQALVYHVFPAYKNTENVVPLPTDDSYFTFNIKAKKTDALCAMLSPNVVLAQDAAVSGTIKNNSARVDFSAEEVGWKNILLRGLQISIVPNSRGVHQVSMNAGGLLLGALAADSIAAEAALDTTGMLLQTTYRTQHTPRKINASMRFLLNEDGERSAAITIFPSVVSLGNKTWNMQECAISIAGSGISISNFTIENNSQSMKIGGSLSASHADSLYAVLRSIDIVPFLELTGKNLHLTGTLSGTAAIKDLTKDKPTWLAANLTANNMFYDNKEIGDIAMSCTAVPHSSHLDARISVVKQQQMVLSVGAAIANDGTINGTADFRNGELYYLELLLKNALSEIHGTGTGRIAIGGTLKDMMLNGKLNIRGCNFVVPFLNTKYIADESTIFDFENSCLLMKDIHAVDTKGNSIGLRGNFNHILQPRSFYYNMEILPTTAMALNTNELQSPIYYGIGYGTGSVKISGKARQCSISVDATTNKGTAINFALGKKGMRSGQAAPLISFVQPKNSTATKPNSSEAVTDITANINFNITPDATFTAALNAASGDAATMNGDGNIKLEVQPLKNVFNVFGNYVIRNGEYAVSVQNLFSKKFKIEPDSRLIFNGPINKAVAVVTAGYKLRAPLSDLFGDSTARYQQPINIECRISITGGISMPQAKFTITAPDADKETQARMQTQFATDNNTEMQFVSLLLTSRFMPPQMHADGVVIFDGMGLAGDVLASALGAFLSQLLPVDVNFNVRSRSDVPGYTGASTTLMREFGSRVVFSTTVDYNSLRQSMDATPQPISANADLEVLLDKSGRFRIRIFGRTNDHYSEMLSGIANNAGSGGVGVVYQEDFNNFTELWEKIFKPKHQ